MTKKSPCLLAVALVAIAPVAFASTQLKATLLPKCPTTAFPKAGTQPESLAVLGTAVAGAFLDKAVDAGIAALKKALNPDASSVEGDFLIQGLYAYRLPSDAEKKADQKAANRVIPNRELACLVIANGDFTGPRADWTLPFEPDADIPAAEAVRLLGDAMGVTAAPQMYFEAVRQLSSDGTAVSWRPVRAYVAQYLNESFWAGSSRGLKVELKFRQPGKAEAFAAFDFTFDSVRKPMSLGPVEFKQRDSGNSGSWLAMPAPTDHFKDLSPSATGKIFDPFTMNVRIVESPKPYKLALIFADAVDSQKDAIKTALKEAAIPSVRREAEITAKEATNTAISDYLTQYEAAVTACESAKVSTEAGKLACVNATAKSQISLDKAKTKCMIASSDNCALLDSLTTPAPSLQSSDASMIAATRTAVSAFIEKRASWVTACKAETVAPEGKPDDQAKLACSLALEDARIAFDTAQVACTKKALTVCSGIVKP